MSQSPAMNERMTAYLEQSGLGSKLSPEEREGLLQELHLTTQKERFKLGFQVRALRICTLVAAFAWLGMYYRISRVEEVALARAYMIQMDKVRVGATAVSKAMDLVLSELAKWVREASEDESSTPEDRAIRIGNLERIGEVVRANRRQFDLIAENAKGIEAPKRMTAETIITDPVTRLAIPLNATADGRLDESVVTQVLGNEKMLMAYLALGKQYGGKGALTMPRGILEAAPPVTLDPNALRAVGVNPEPVRQWTEAAQQANGGK